MYIYWQLFYTFFSIGIFTFGGGYAMLSLIQSQVVTAHGWITESTFTDIVAISQMTPGPIGTNSATYIGYEVVRAAGGNVFECVLGSLIATISIIIPSYLIIMLMVRFYEKFKTNNTFESIMGFLRPCVVGMIGSAALILVFKINWHGIPLLSDFDFSIIKENFIDYRSYIICIVATVVSLKFKIGPIPVILLSGLAGYLFM